MAIESNSDCLKLNFKEKIFVIETVYYPYKIYVLMIFGLKRVLYTQRGHFSYVCILYSIYNKNDKLGNLFIKLKLTSTTVYINI